MYVPFFQAWVDRDPSPSGGHPTLGSQADPEGIGELLARYRDEYGTPAVYSTENGTTDHEAIVTAQRVNDAHRILYLRAYLTELAKAIAAGSDVRGYFVWSLLDNFEWSGGYAPRMGLAPVDYPTQQRIIKDSGYWYRDLIRGQ